MTAKKRPSQNSSERHFVMGIDPGTTGAVALIDTRDASFNTVFDIPNLKRPSTSRKQGYVSAIDLPQLSTHLEFYAAHTAFCALEEPTAAPKQGMGSTFNFGLACGQIQGILAAHRIPVMLVAPSAWKMALGLSSDKRASMELATRYYPNFQYHWSLLKHNDRAEAVLLAIYGIKRMAQGDRGV